VHGTGAGRPDWTQPGSSTLCKYLDKTVEGVSFSSCVWSGKNTDQARADGAKRLREDVLNATSDGRLTILVGHSHGGSVIAYALAEEDALWKQVSGVIFLATPFLQARQLPLGAHLPKGPALLTGLLCAAAVIVVGLVLLTAVGWPEDQRLAFGVRAFGLPYAGLVTWWLTYIKVVKFLGLSEEGCITERTKKRLDGLVHQLDLSVLETRGLNRKSLVIRSTADEAASGLAAAQLAGRIASDIPSLTWKLPRWGWDWLKWQLGLGNLAEPPGWLVWAFAVLVLAATAGFSIRAAAWLSDWPVLQLIDTQIRNVGSSAFRTVLTAFVWVAIGVVLLLLATVPLIIIGMPLKLVGLFLYGLRGWPALLALYLELSVEPAPPGEWRVHQVDSSKSEVEGETTLAHSFVYDDPRAHRAIEEWLKTLHA